MAKITYDEYADRVLELATAVEYGMKTNRRKAKPKEISVLREAAYRIAYIAERALASSKEKTVGRRLL